MATDPRKCSEADVQLSICRYLEARGYFFWRQNTYGIYDTRTGRHRKAPKYSITGLPDIIVVRGGQFIGIEVKSKRGTQSDNQDLFMQRLRNAGGTYILARSVDDVIAAGI